MSQTKQQPIFKKQLKGDGANISSVVFENFSEKGHRYASPSIQRSYKKDGNWHENTIYLRHLEISQMIIALQAMLEFLNNDFRDLSASSDDALAVGSSESVAA